jgi:hypothetical protein
MGYLLWAKRNSVSLRPFKCIVNRFIFDRDAFREPEPANGAAKASPSIAIIEYIQSFMSQKERPG